MPAHLQIFEALQADLASMTPGDRLPDRGALCERFGVSHATVSKALCVLRAEKLIVNHPGRGMFVV